MAFFANDVRLGAPKLYPLKALSLGIGAPVAKPRASLGAAHTAANAVLRHDKTVSEENWTWLQTQRGLTVWPQPSLRTLIAERTTIAIASSNESIS